MIDLRQRKFILPIIVVLVAALMVVGVILLQHRADQQAADAKSQQAAAELTGFRNTLDKPKAFSSLTPEKQEALLAQKAHDFGLSRTTTPTPVGIAEACIADKSRELSLLTRTYRGAIEEQRDELNAAVRDIQDYCYKAYTPEGKMSHDRMPMKMAH